jgi:hypothetical protein
MDIGNFSKHVLLTGAGWSRNWGARLADGVWQLLMDDPDVAANDRLRTMLLDEPSFELALAKTQVAPFTLDDREQFTRALDGIRTLGSAPPLRDRWFADSPLEGDGFEPSVPAIRTMVFARTLRPDSGPERDYGAVLGCPPREN